MEEEVKNNFEEIGQLYLASQVKNTLEFISINKILYKEQQEVELDGILFQSLLKRDKGMFSEANTALNEDGIWQAYIYQKDAEKALTDYTCNADLTGEADMHFTHGNSLNEHNSLEEVPNLNNEGFEDRDLAIDSYRMDNVRNENIYSSIFYPSDSENWVSWLATKIIEDWRNLNLNSISPEIIIIEISLSRATEETVLNNFDKFNNSRLLSLEIAVRISHVIETVKKVNYFFSLNLKEKLDEQVRELVDWISQSSASTSSSQSLSLSPVERIQIKKQQLSHQRRLILEETYLKLQQHLGSQALLNWMNRLDELLVESLDYYEQKRSECLKKEDSSRKAYYTLIKDLNKIYRFQTDWEAIKKGLNNYSNLKLKTECYHQICRLLDEAREQVKGYIDNAIRWDEYLENVQNWFANQCLSEPLFAPMLEKHRHNIDTLKLLREVEKVVGFSFNNWMSLNAHQNKFLKQEMAVRLQPFCKELYQEYCQHLRNASTNSQSFLGDF